MNILAKPNYTLKSHVCDLLCVLDGIEQFFPRFLRANMIPLEFQTFLRDVIWFSICCHDIGKANWWFQHLIMGDRSIVQRYRHEHISGIILHKYLQSYIVDWFESRYPDMGVFAYQLIFYSVVHHHGKINIHRGADHEYVFGVGNELSTSAPARGDLFYGNSVDINWILNEIGFSGLLPDVLLSELFDEDVIENIGHSWFNKIGNNHKSFMESDKKLSNSNSYVGRFIVFCKTMLIFCDGVGSCDARKRGYNINVTDYVVNGLTSTCKDELKKVIEKTKSKIEANHGKFEFTGAQTWIATQCEYDRVASIAGAGSGKSIQHYNHGIQSPHDIQYFIVLLPTMGTTTSQMEDYGLFSDSSALVHSGSDVALSAIELKMKANGDDEFDKNDYKLDASLYSIAAYGKKIIYATYDQMLSSVVNSYNGIMLLPMLWSSVIIVDEPHSVDTRLFSSLSVFFSMYNIRTLFTSASMPSNRLTALTKIGFHTFQPEFEDGFLFESDRNQSKIERYRVAHIGGVDACLSDVIADYNAGIKTLIIFNRSESATRFYRLVIKQLGYDPNVVHDDILCYHGKLINGTKGARHQKVMDLSRNPATKKILVISTQISEMALDIKMKIYTEEAPLWSFIQRIARGETRGQIALDAKPTDVSVFTVLGSCLVDYNTTEKVNAMPYNINDINHAKCKLDLGKGERKWTEWSQKDLAIIMNTTYSKQDKDDKNEIEKYFPTEAHQTRRDVLRHADSVTGVLEMHEKEYQDAIKRNDLIAKSSYEISLSIYNEFGKLKKGFFEPKVEKFEDVRYRVFKFDPKLIIYNDIIGCCKVFDVNSHLLGKDPYVE